MRSFALLCAACLLSGMSASVPAQVGIGVTIGPEPICPYGYFDYPPYDCAPYGYYGPDWFVNGCSSAWDSGSTGLMASTAMWTTAGIRATDMQDRCPRAASIRFSAFTPMKPATGTATWAWQITMAAANTAAALWAVGAQAGGVRRTDYLKRAVCRRARPRLRPAL